jgi:hypothetical protein
MDTFCIRAQVREHRKDFWRAETYVVTVSTDEPVATCRARAAKMATDKWLARGLQFRYTEILPGPMRYDGEPCTEHWFKPDNGSPICCAHCNTPKERCLP